MVADAAGGEAGGVGLAADELLAAELGDRGPRLGRVQERVVLLGRQAGHRLEPVGVVGRPPLHRPFLHRGGHDVGHVRVERGPLLDRVAQGLVHVLGQARPHHFIGEHIGAEELADRQVVGQGASAFERPRGGSVQRQERVRSCATVHPGEGQSRLVRRRRIWSSLSARPPGGSAWSRATPPRPVAHSSARKRHAW